MKEPFLGVPAGKVRVENPDGIYLGSPDNHNLYDAGQLRQPLIPGDYDRDRVVPKTPNTSDV